MNIRPELDRPVPIFAERADPRKVGPGTVEAGVEVIVASTPEQLALLKPLWEETNIEADLDFDNYMMVVAAHDAIPYVFAVMSDGEPTALLIGRLETADIPLQLGYKVFGNMKVRQIKFPRNGFLGDCSTRHAQLLFSSVMLSLKKGTADRVFFGGLDQNSDLCGCCSEVRSFLCRDGSRMLFDHWKVTLPASWEEYLKQRSSKSRWALRRVLRFLEEENPGRVSYRVYERPDQVEAFCLAAETVAAKSYQRALGVGFMNSPEDRRFLEQIAARGWLKGYIVAIDDVPLCFWSGRLYHGTLFSDWTGFDPAFEKYEPGTVVLCKMIEDLCRSKATGIDFGCGTAFYKERFGDRNDVERWICAYAPTFRGVFANLVVRVVYGFIGQAKIIANKLRILDWMKKRWRRGLTRAASGQLILPGLCESIDEPIAGFMRVSCEWILST